MIIVTGTKRSGTSMWMQVIQAAGFSVIGEAFPGKWRDTLHAANPDGFYESILRRGIFWRTNPHPKTGRYLFAEETTWHAVKVFIPGLIRSDIAFVTKVIATMRHWRDYDASIRRLYDIEHEARVQREGPDARKPHRISPLLEWWGENFSLVSDAVTRRYPLHLVAYDEVLKEPERTIREAIDWLGIGDSDAAIAVVKPDKRTQDTRDTSNDTVLGVEITDVFEALYEVVLERKPLEQSFVEKLNETQAKLLPLYEEESKKVEADAKERRRRNEDSSGGYDDESASPG